MVLEKIFKSIFFQIGLICRYGIKSSKLQISQKYLKYIKKLISIKLHHTCHKNGTTAQISVHLVEKCGFIGSEGVINPYDLFITTAAMLDD